MRKCPWNAAVNRKRCLGKTYEQMYGKAGAARIRAKMRAAQAKMVRRARRNGYVHPFAGVTWEEQFGEERANEIKRRLSFSLIMYRRSGAMA